jgi:hypothetical protein
MFLCSGATAPQPHLLDVTPTVCALLDVGAGKVMTGHALADLLDIDTADRGGSWSCPAAPSSAGTAPVPPDLREQLETLGAVE